MPGVYRPYTLVDILGTLNQQSSQQQGAELVSGLGDFGEVDETLGAIDSMASTVQVNPAWDAGFWGTVTWG